MNGNSWHILTFPMNEQGGKLEDNESNGQLQGEKEEKKKTLEEKLLDAVIKNDGAFFFYIWKILDNQKQVSNYFKNSNYKLDQYFFFLIPET